nr:RecName: Full=Diptericin [Sarcophaga peregrina]AAB23889.1 8 kda protein=diptericin homolog {N-terminal} [Sarcophaga peregrina=flesh flies, larvae, fat body, Peptide Partial, 37 aa] [Sarcophaga peregrina]
DLHIPPPDNKINWPQLSGGGGGSPKTGYDININAQQK